MRTFNVVVELDPDTGRQNLREVVEMLLEDGDPKLEAEFVGVEIIQVA